MRYYWLCFSFLSSLFSENNSPFIESVKEIEIPNFKGAYNPSIVDLGDRYLLFFRYDIYEKPIWSLLDYTMNIGYVILDEAFSIISEPKLIKDLGDQSIDPRVIRNNDDLFVLSASPIHKEDKSKLFVALFLSKLKIQNDEVIVEDKKQLFVPWQNRWEKNWAPFIDNDRLLLSYTIVPHVVIEPLETGKCSLVSKTESLVDWSYGEIRGGTGAILDGNEYLAFFHSSKKINNKLHRYFMGAYRYEKEFPYKLTSISKKPFICSDFYTTKKGVLSSSDVIFPGGFVIKQNKIFLVYGENDAGIKLMTIDKNKLMNKLQSPKTPRKRIRD